MRILAIIMLADEVPVALQHPAHAAGGACRLVRPPS
jgi:hypothetical protein